MKDYLETLEIGDNKIKLSKEEIKNILAEHGKSVTTETNKIVEDKEKEITNYKTTIDDLKKQIESSPKSDELESLKTKIADFEVKETERVRLEQERAKEVNLDNNINEAIGDKKFINDFTKTAIVSEIKNALKDSTNAGKSAKEIFEAMTKDKNDIFVNPNKPADMPSGNDGEDINNVQQIPTLW